MGGEAANVKREAVTSPGLSALDGKKRLPRPIVHALGRIEQILACADRLMERCDRQSQD